jgi:hypothetical protein
MKPHILIIILLYAFLQFANATSQSNATKPDTTETVTSIADTAKEEVPDFTGVDVVVETEWSDPEKNENVDVFVNLKDKHPNIVMREVTHKLCEVRILKGVVIKISDHSTGKLLKTFKKED